MTQDKNNKKPTAEKVEYRATSRTKKTDEQETLKYKRVSESTKVIEEASAPDSYSISNPKTTVAPQSAY